MRIALLLALGVFGCSSTTTETSPAPVLSDAGAVVEDADAGISAPPDAAPQCLAVGGNCHDKPDSCCSGSTCVYDTKEPSKSICAANCLNGTQCNTGCCTVLIQGTSAVCAPASYCKAACMQPGGDCTASACCANAICVNSTVDGTRCAARCTGPTQCQSGCCAPLSDTGELVCSPPQFCAP